MTSFPICFHSMDMDNFTFFTFHMVYTPSPCLHQPHGLHIYPISILIYISPDIWFPHIVLDRSGHFNSSHSLLDSQLCIFLHFTSPFTNSHEVFQNIL